MSSPPTRRASRPRTKRADPSANPGNAAKTLISSTRMKFARRACALLPIDFLRPLDGDHPPLAIVVRAIGTICFFSFGIIFIDAK